MGGRRDQGEDWVVRVFGSLEAWRKSLPRGRVAFGRPRKEVIHIQLVKADGPAWKLPCPDTPLPDDVLRAVQGMVTGIGPRPRLEYEFGGKRRIAVGRRGEPADRLRAELVSLYGLRPIHELRQSDGLLADYAASGGSYRPFARKMGIRNSEFLVRAAEPAQVERSAVMNDRQLERVWRLFPVYEAGNDEPGRDGPEEMTEVVIGDLGGEAPAPAPLPMAIPKADGRGAHSQYLGHALDTGGGRRWNLLEFEPPLRIALGGALNRMLGFGDSTHVNEVIPYRGDGYHWGRKNPMPGRTPLGRDQGPVCRVLHHPDPAGDWFPWLGTPYPVPSVATWDVWQRRRTHYDRMRKKSRNGNRNGSQRIPNVSG